MPSNTPILMLGVAGLGLSLAMFFDTKKKIKEDEDNLKNKIIKNEQVSTENVTKVIDIYDMPETVKTTEEKEEEYKEEEEEKEVEVNENTVNYKDLYLQEVSKNKDKEVLVQDNRYKGDGSKFSKNLYFMKEAYRRSREQVPVDQNIALAVKIASQISDDDDESICSIDSVDPN
jgi:hypothetical protein